jgi:gas vesicle protein
MFGPRMLFGAVVGGALVYFLDPKHGAQRREQVRDWWEQNREPVMNSASSAASAVQAKAAETSSKVGERVNQAGEIVNEKVTELGSRVRREANRVPVE